jgi:hypothetical protein
MSKNINILACICWRDIKSLCLFLGILSSYRPQLGMSLFIHLTVQRNQKF